MIIHTSRLLFLCFILLFMNYSQAGTITINQTANASIVGNKLFVDISLSNTGDSPAYNLLPRIVFLGKTNSLSPLKILPDGESFKWSTELSLGNEGRGEFHILSLVGYDDDKNNRHTNTGEMYLNTVSITERFLELSINIESSDNFENQSTLVVKNASSEKLDVELQFITADSVAINQEYKIISLEGSGQFTLPIILNSSGFKELGSKPLYIITRYAKDDVFYSQMISVSPQEFEKDGVLRSFFSSPEKMMIVVGVLLLMLFVILIINLRSRRKI